MKKLLTLLLLLTLVACGSESKLYGTWRVTEAKVDDPNGTVPVAIKQTYQLGMIDTRYSLSEDGTFAKTYVHSAGMNEKGKWELNKNTLTFLKPDGTKEVWVLEHEHPDGYEVRQKADREGGADMLLTIEKDKE